MKRIMFVALLAAVALSGCAKKEAAPIAVIKDITERVEAVLEFDTKGMYNVPEDDMTGLLNVSGDLFTDFVMKIPTGTNQNEYGVFIAAEGREKEAEETVRSYLQSRKDAWDRQYLAEEGLKIDGGQCKAEGRYVYFVIGCDNFEDVNDLFEDLAWEK